MQVGDGLGDQGFDKARPKAGQDHTRKEEGIVPRQDRHDEADGDTETRQDEQGLGADHPQKLDRDDEDKSVFGNFSFYRSHFIILEKI